MSIDDEQSPTEEKRGADWTGPIIVALVAPVFFLFVYLGKAQMGFTACIVLGMIMIAIRFRWRLRIYAWFWGTIGLVLALHIPLLFVVRWPHTNYPTIGFSMPLGIADFLIVSAAISLAEKIFLRGPSSHGESP